MALILLWLSALALAFALTRFSALPPLLVALALPTVALAATFLLFLAFPPTSPIEPLSALLLPLCVLCGSLPGAFWGGNGPQPS
jgi:hypothetical protein